MKLCYLKELHRITKDLMILFYSYYSIILWQGGCGLLFVIGLRGLSCLLLLVYHAGCRYGGLPQEFFNKYFLSFNFFVFRILIGQGLVLFVL
jgi:hypothetical protein